MAKFNQNLPVHRALWNLNIHRGRGDIIAVDGNTFTREPFGLQPETRRYRTRGNRVYALGSSRKLV